MSSIQGTNFIEIVLWLLKRRQRFRVEGISMLPLLQPNDEVLVNLSAYRDKLPSAGDIVIVEHPYKANFYMIKRIIFVNEKGECFVQGDNLDHSTDSRSFGLVKCDLIKGLVTCKFFS